LTKQRVLDYLGWQAGTDTITDPAEAAKWRMLATVVGAVIVGVLIRVIY